MQVTNPSAIAVSATQAQNSVSLLSQSTLYSADVGGKTYAADITLSSGEYVASVPQLPGVRANGNTLLAAENNLNARISVLV
jgi:hypothetical protein